MKRRFGKRCFLLVAVVVLMIASLGTGAEMVNAAFAQGEEITTSPITLKVGEGWAVSNSNIDPLISEEAVSLSGGSGQAYPMGEGWEWAIVEEEYLVGTYKIDVKNKSTGEVLHSGYYTEAERQVFVAEYMDGTLEERYGTKVTWTETSSPFYAYAKKAGETFISIPGYRIGTYENYVEVDLLIPVIIQEAGAKEPKPEENLDYEPVPTVTEHVLEDGQKVRMITEKGNPYEYIIGDINVVNSDWSFSCQEIFVGQGYDIAKNAVDTQIGTDYKFKLYDMSVTMPDGTLVHELPGNVDVTLLFSLSSDFDENDMTVVVYDLDMESGELTRHDTVLYGEWVTFSTNHFSYYVVVEQEACEGPVISPKTGDVSMIPVMMVAISAMGTAVVAMKKRQTL